jgi:two-component system, LytTR family, response regulator
MTKSRFSYVVVEDDLKVCEGVKLRMNAFPNWNCLGLIPSFDLALKTIQDKQPNLLFLDYSILGGNTFNLLEQIKKIDNYNPFIIYFTAYGSDKDFISEDAINKYRVNKFLNKPIWEKLTEYLDAFLNEAETWIKTNENSYLWLVTLDKTKVKIEPNKIICINQPENNPRFKTIRTTDNEVFDIKASWSDCERIAKEHCINFCYTKARDTIINKKYITKIQKPHIWLNDFLKITVSKERWKELGI